MDKFFKLTEKGTDVRTEVLAGLTTFFAMSYILFVNPAMLAQTGMPKQGVFLATIIGACCRHLNDGLLCNLPYAQAPGMGLNAFFHFLRSSLPWATLGRKPWLWSLSAGLFRSLSL